ncbi:MAG: hypothetical protein Q8L81_07595 [Bacteroidota bacterium]|nr:hypothetical protein [Bacteroidota bacterium]
MEGGIFLTIKDLMKLIGSDSYKSAAREHLAIRDAMKKKVKKITIKEYCEFEMLDFAYVWGYLRNKIVK